MASSPTAFQAGILIPTPVSQYGTQLSPVCSHSERDGALHAYMLTLKARDDDLACVEFCLNFNGCDSFGWPPEPKPFAVTVRVVTFSD
ncbi:uncharacterized [Tachysurus ichikawai]